MNVEQESDRNGSGASSPIDRRALLIGGGAATLGLAIPGLLSAQTGSPGYTGRLNSYMMGKGSDPKFKRPRFAPGSEVFKFTTPPGKRLGNISSVGVSPINGDVFIWNSSIVSDTPVPPAERLEPICRFDKNGKYITSFGGPSSAPTIDGDNQWPATPDNVEVDAEGNVWISPDLRSGDNATLCYSPDGKFLRQFGVHNNPGSGVHDKMYFNHPSSVVYDPKTQTYFIADGYGSHRRIVSIDRRTGEMTRMWGAYGKDPAYFDYNAARLGGIANSMGGLPSDEVGHSIEPDKRDGYSTVIHQIIMAPDGRLLVADRGNSRIQEFEILPGGVRYIRQVYVAPQTDSFGTSSAIAVSPDGRWLFSSSMRDHRVYIIDRTDFKVVNWVSVAPEQEGFDLLPVNRKPFHRMARASNGDLLCVRIGNKLYVKKYLGVY